MFASSRSFPHGHFHQLQLPSFVFQNQPTTELKSIYWHSVAYMSILASSLACPEDLRQVPSLHCASVFPLVKCCFGTLMSWAWHGHCHIEVKTAVNHSQLTLTRSGLLTFLPRRWARRVNGPSISILVTQSYASPSFMQSCSSFMWFGEALNNIVLL